MQLRFSTSAITVEGTPVLSEVRDAVGEYAAALVAGLLGVSYGVLKFFKLWKTESAEVSIIDQLRKQVDLLMVQNTNLQEALNNVSKKLIEINGQLSIAHAENAQLRAAIERLNPQLTKLIGETDDSAQPDPDAR